MVTAVTVPELPTPVPELVEGRAWQVAATVCDPEIPVLTIEDLGILRTVEEDGGRVRVQITPTYSGCPAMDAIRDDVGDALRDNGYTDVRVELVLSPAWTTDWMSESGKQKLREYGIAAPSGHAAANRPSLPTGTAATSLRDASEPAGVGPSSGTALSKGPIRLTLAVKCPRCDSLNTRELARFGSTSCKALYECRDCLEPFDYFKVL
jgi:ring-1,2-phenylacetyl-CoA epoxidase subunit PaaD